MGGTPRPVLRSARRPASCGCCRRCTLLEQVTSRSCPRGPSSSRTRTRPAARAAIPALAARVARQCSSHICLRRPLAGGGRLVVARDIDVICDALADYEPEEGWRRGRG